MEYNRRHTDRNHDLTAEKILEIDADNLTQFSIETRITANELINRESGHKKEALLRIIMERKAPLLRLVIDTVQKQKPHELSQEQTEALLNTLQTRFEANPKRHNGVKWSNVKKSLEKNPDVLLSIDGMEKEGHEPDIYSADKKGFDVGTCSKESPESGRNCLYDEQAAQLLGKNHPSERFNGSAVAMAEAIGVQLMSEKQYRHLQISSKVDEQTGSWLLTDSDGRSIGNALNGNSRDGYVYVYHRKASDHNDRRAWRGSLRVKWTA